MVASSARSQVAGAGLLRSWLVLLVYGGIRGLQGFRAGWRGVSRLRRLPAYRAGVSRMSRRCFQASASAFPPGGRQNGGRVEAGFCTSGSTALLMANRGANFVPKRRMRW